MMPWYVTAFLALVGFATCFLALMLIVGHYVQKRRAYWEARHAKAKAQLDAFNKNADKWKS